jgi:uncharacterized protein with LGFP repeats
MFRSFVCKSLLLLLAGLAASESLAASPATVGGLSVLHKAQRKALIIGNYRCQYVTTWDKWYSRRQTLGVPKTDELNDVATGTGTKGTAMRFNNGMITRMTTGVRAGTTAMMFGGIWNKYEQSGGLHGRVGFPTGNSYVWMTSTNAYAQNFEKGQIYFDDASRTYIVKYNN